MQPKDFKALMLRTCAADMTARNGFEWPESGWCEAPDWKPTEECGNGLHGALWGEGDGGLFNWDADAKWMVCGIDEWIDLNGKVKAPKAYVLFCGNRKDATDYIIANGARGAVIGGTATAGDGGTATAGYRGTATAGDKGTATAGDKGTATAGYRGTATAGDRGIICIKWWDGNRYRMAVGHVREDGIDPNVAYRCEGGKLVKA